MKSTKYTQQQFCSWFLKKSTKVKSYPHDVFIDIHRIEHIFREKQSSLYQYSVSHIGTHFMPAAEVSPERLYRNRCETSEFYTISFQYDEKWQQHDITVTRYSANDFLKLTF